MGCFLRHNFEKELKSRSQQHESQSQNLRPRLCHCRRSEMRQSAGCSCLLSATNARGQLKEPERLVRLQ